MSWLKEVVQRAVKGALLISDGSKTHVSLSNAVGAELGEGGSADRLKGPLSRDRRLKGRQRPEGRF